MNYSINRACVIGAAAMGAAIAAHLASAGIPVDLLDVVPDSLTPAEAADGPARLIFAFETVIIGGLGSLWGTSGQMRTPVEFFTLLALAQMWDLLAGYGGMVSMGQQAWIGLGAMLCWSSPTTSASTCLGRSSSAGCLPLW